MRVHGNQFDPNFQVNALHAAARAEAKRAAERTRRKLLSAASELAGEYDDAADCVVMLSEDNASQEQANRESRQNQGDQKKQNEQENPEIIDTLFSDWA